MTLELDSPFYKIFDDAKPKTNSITIKIEADAKSKVDSLEIQDSFAQADIKIIRPPLKRKARTGGPGSQAKCKNLGRHLHV